MVNVMVIENIFGDEYINIYILITIIIAIQWVRAISAFYVSRFFGPLIKILANMLIDLVKFMVIMGISFFIFCCIGSTLFRDLTSYANIQTAMLTLFQAALGGFDFTVFYDLDSTVLKTLGFIFLTGYLIFMMITLLNFVIAILSDTYAFLSNQSQSLYLKEVILLEHRLGHEKNLSCIVSAWVPFNLILIPLVPFILIFNKYEIINSIILHIVYIPFSLFALTCYITVVVLMYPFAYLVVLLFRLKLLFYSKGKTSWLFRFLSFAMWLFLGPFILIVYFLIDLTVFVM